VTFEERHHISGKPQEVVELYHTLDRFCLSLEPGSIDRKFTAKYVRYSRGKRIFCSIHLQQSGLRLWLTLKFAEVAKPPRFARDVTHVGHWGTGDVELDIAKAADIEESLALIRQSFEAAM
jgi:predicted transport protein